MHQSVTETGERGDFIADLKETAIYRIAGDKHFCVESGETAWINKVIKWKSEHPNDVEIIADNGGKYVLAHLSTSRFNFKVSVKKELSAEQKATLTARLSKNAL